MSLATVTKAAERHSEAQRERDRTYAALARAIQKAAGEGSSYAEIAEAAGISRQRVHQIVRS